MPKPNSPTKRRSRAKRAIVLATPQGKIQFAETTARRWLKEFFGRPARAGLLPAQLHQWLKTHEQLGPPILLAARPDNARLLVAKDKFSTEQTTVLQLELISGKRKEHSRRHRALTARERDVYEWLSCGKSNPEIAAILGRKTATVKKHLERVYAKLGVESRAAAISLDLMQPGNGKLI